MNTRPLVGLSFSVAIPLADAKEYAANKDLKALKAKIEALDELGKAEIEKLVAEAIAAEAENDNKPGFRTISNEMTFAEFLEKRTKGIFTTSSERNDNINTAGTYEVSIAHRKGKGKTKSNYDMSKIEVPTLLISKGTYKGKFIPLTDVQLEQLTTYCKNKDASTNKLTVTVSKYIKRDADGLEVYAFQSMEFAD